MIATEASIANRSHAQLSLSNFSQKWWMVSQLDACSQAARIQLSFTFKN